LEIDEIIDDMKRHTIELRSEVRMEDIKETRHGRRLLEYSTIQTDLRPTFYEERLNHVFDRVCQGTEDWLLQDADVVKWLNVTQDSPKIIWLHGIPGAGKTIISIACWVWADKLIRQITSCRMRCQGIDLAWTHNLCDPLA
jgi:SpoVK/Ycf46/Vps4 family AAA+-type ATPase